MKNLTYLAIPYTFNPEYSFEIVNKVAAKLMNQGKIIFSPVSHSHPISNYLDERLRTSQEFWMNQDLPILSKCDEMYIIVIGKEGRKLIDNSKGCVSELEKAKELGINVTYYYHEE